MGDEHRDIYRLQRARFDRLASEVARRISIRLRTESILHFMTFRSKHPDDVAEKLTRKRTEGSQKYIDVGVNLGEVMTDLAGVRIVVYEPEQEQRAAQLVRETLNLASGPQHEVDFVKPAMLERAESDGYRATHLLVTAPSDDPLTAGAVCEVQVCNIVAHVFNEFEHDILYKFKRATPSVKTRQALEAVRQKTRGMEEAVAELMKRHKRDVQEQGMEINDAQELRQGLEGVLGKSLTGEFELLFFLVRSFFTPLTVHNLRVAVANARGRVHAEVLGLHEPDDATVLALAWAETRRDELPDVLEAWTESHPEAPGAMVDALRRLRGESNA